MIKEAALKNIVFSEHARDKFSILEQHGFIVSEAEVIAAILSSDKILPGYGGRNIAQKATDEKHVIRVVFENFPDMIKIITFYPGRRKRYEDEV